LAAFPGLTIWMAGDESHLIFIIEVFDSHPGLVDFGGWG
jgi:hypothetical protein